MYRDLPPPRRKLVLRAEEFKMAAIQNAISYEIFDIIMLQRSVISLFQCFIACRMQRNNQKVITVNIKRIKSKMVAKIFFFTTFSIHTRNLTDLSVSATIRHPMIFSSHLLLFNTSGVCRPLRHRLSTSMQPAIHKSHKPRGRS